MEEREGERRGNVDPQSPKPSYAPVCMQFFDSLHTCTLRETVRSSFDHLVLIHHFTSSLSAGKTAGTPLTQVVLLFRHARKLFCNTIVFILATLSWRDTCNGPCRSASVTIRVFYRNVWTDQASFCHGGFLRLDFDTPLFSITTFITESSLPSRPNSWLPHTNPPYLTLASIHFISARFHDRSCGTNNTVDICFFIS